MSKGEDVLFFDAVLLILLTAFGTATNPAVLTQLNSIGPPVPSKPPSQGGCVPYVFIVWPVCLNTLFGNSNNSLATATENIAWAILNIPGLIFWGINAFLIFANVVLAIVFSPSLSVNSVPFLGFAIVGLQLYVVFEVFRMFRGSSSGV